MLLICIFVIIILGIIIVQRPITIIWMGRYIRNKLLLFIIKVRSNSVPRWCCFGCSVYKAHIHHAYTYKLSLATRLHGQQLTLYNLYMKK